MGDSVLLNCSTSFLFVVTRPMHKRILGYKHLQPTDATLKYALVIR